MSGVAVRFRICPSFHDDEDDLPLEIKDPLEASVGVSQGNMVTEWVAAIWIIDI